MPSFSGLVTQLTSVGFYYEKSSHIASKTFNQESTVLYRNNPRVPFEYFININLNNLDTAKTFIDQNFNNTALQQMQPLVKTVDMPSFKIDTVTLNQYNRKRVAQNRIDFEPIKMVFHDVCDGKTLKFWDMYYRYYFMDGIEYKNNAALPSVVAAGKKPPYSIEDLVANITPTLNSSIANLPGSLIKSLTGNKTGTNPPTSYTGSKQSLDNILSNTLDNQNFGFNLQNVQNIRNLIQSIEIYQVHAGRYNKVTLVNPRISAFTHDVLNYAETAKTLELTFTFTYEYAFYNIVNAPMTEEEGLDRFQNTEFLDLPALAFNTTLLDFLENNNPLLNSDNPILQRIGQNVQSSLGSVTGAFLSDQVVRRVSASALDGLAQISPKPYVSPNTPPVVTRSFAQASTKSLNYQDVNRTGNG